MKSKGALGRFCSVFACILTFFGLPISAIAGTYYVADGIHGGSYGNLGTVSSPWSLVKGLDSISSGDTLLLQCGNVFEGEFVLRSTLSYITFDSYGSGARPIIKASGATQNPAGGVCLTLPDRNNYISISNIDFANAKYGILWRNDIPNTTNTNLEIVGCDFSYMNYYSDAGNFGSAIRVDSSLVVGGSFQNITVNYCIFGKQADSNSGCFNGLLVIAGGWAYNVSAIGCQSYYAGSGAVSFTKVYGGTVASWYIADSGKDVANHLGSAGVYIQASDNVTIDDCWISNTRHYGYQSDGAAIAIETGNPSVGFLICHNITIQNCHLYDNQGPAVALLGDYASYDTSVKYCTIWNNNTMPNAWDGLFSAAGVPETFYRATFVNFHVAGYGSTGSFVSNTFLTSNPFGEYGDPLSYYAGNYHGFQWDPSHFTYTP